MMHYTDDPMYDDMLRVREERLERRRFALDYAVSGRVLMQHYDRKYLEHLSHEMRIRLSCDIWCKDSQVIVMFEPVSYPATWWEHLKQRWFPRWALRRWPVRLATVTRPDVTVKAAAMFPFISTPDDPRDHMAVRFMITDPVVRP